MKALSAGLFILYLCSNRKKALILKYTAYYINKNMNVNTNECWKHLRQGTATASTPLDDIMLACYIYARPWLVEAFVKQLFRR